MVHDCPLLAFLHEGEAVACRQHRGLSVLEIRECVRAGGDGSAAGDANQMLAECDLETGQDLERGDEVVTQRRSIRSNRRRERPPKNPISRIEKYNVVRIISS